MWSRNWLFSALAILLLAVAPASLGLVSEALLPGARLERPLEEGRRHHYTADLGPGSWRVSVEQLGINTVLELQDLAGASLAVADLPFQRFGPESLVLEGEEPRAVHLEVRPLEKGIPPGRYRITLERLGVESQRLDAERAMALAARGTARRQDLEDEAAAVHLEAAADTWRGLGEKEREAQALHALGLVHRRLGKPREAADCLEQALGLWRALGSKRWIAAALNSLGLALWELGDSSSAEPYFEEAVSVGDELREAYPKWVGRNNLCLLAQSRGDMARAGVCYREILEGLADSPDQQLLGIVHGNLGSVYDRLGEPDLARRHLLRALAMSRAAGNRRREAVTLNNLASMDRHLGNWRAALDGWTRALELHRALGEERREAVALNNLGFAYLRLGDYGRAKDFLLAALPLRRAVQDLRGEAITLNHLATVHRQLGAVGLARANRRQSLELRRRLGDARGEARILVWTGRDALADGDPHGALVAFERALGIFSGKAVEDPRNAAQASVGRGLARAALGRLDDAVADLEGALERQQQLSDSQGEISTRASLAALERQRGRPEEALEHATAAIRRIETSRDEVPSPELRSIFLASRRKAYELRIDLLFEKGRRSGEKIFVEEALTTAERARSRALLDLLAESQIDAAKGLDAVVLERLRHLRDRLRLLSARRPPTFEAAAELEGLEARIRRENPAFAELTRPEPLTAQGIQALLDGQTTLLQYALGEDRSVLWRVTRDELEAHELPPQAVLEGLTRRVYEEMAVVTVGGAQPAEKAATELADVILGPVAGVLEGQRLAIVADGALVYIPFAALPWAGSESSPEGDAEPLMARFEVVHLPSASALRALRARKPVPPERQAVVFADPVFRREDPRLALGSWPGEGPPVPPAPFAFDRLPGSRAEAETLLSLLPPGQVTVALDAAASREAVLQGALEKARVIHLATHGVVDTAHPERSGLVLSQVDARGLPLDGFLSLRDIYELDLEAELVVLSGCRTAIGREIRGEGLVGLTQGFFSAGAGRVLASLWAVEDRATAALMTHFYEGLFLRGQRPAAALRSAQEAVRSERRWRHPSYWAAFVLQGDWR